MNDPAKTLYPNKRLEAPDEPPPVSTTTPVNDEEAWRLLLNLLYLSEQDDLFRWAKTVRAAVCGDEGKRTPRIGT